MLLAILLLLVAVGLLGAALVTGQIALAWGSVGVSAVLAVVLLALRRRSRRRRRDAAEAIRALLADVVAQGDPVYGDPVYGGPALSSSAGSATAAGQADPATSDRPPDSDEVAGSGEVAQPGASGASGADEDAEPDEEDTDAADLMVVWEMLEEVLVVDEHPRYHLARCEWPDTTHAERLPVREARELGFTPCAQCRPDAALVRRHRAASAT
ncbi:MAG: hypothetical protein ACRDSL_16230 [Pseudonocardiaceae bacterium]